jgi:hypothetical protein
MFFALETTAAERPPGRLRQILARKRRPVPFTMGSGNGVVGIAAEQHALSCFVKADGSLTVQANLVPGRYVMHVRAASSEAVGLMVRVGGERARQVARLGPRCKNLSVRLDVETPAQELHVSLSGPVSFAVIGDFALWLEVDESKPQIVTRKLLNRARRRSR